MKLNNMMWWGYLHINGTIQVKRWWGDVQDYTTDCHGNPFVKRVITPFEADSYDEAYRIICDRLSVPEMKIQWMRRLGIEVK